MAQMLEYFFFERAVKHSINTIPWTDEYLTIYFHCVSEKSTENQCLNVLIGIQKC